LEAQLSFTGMEETNLTKISLTPLKKTERRVFKEENFAEFSMIRPALASPSGGASLRGPKRKGVYYDISRGENLTGYLVQDTTGVFPHTVN